MAPGAFELLGETSTFCRAAMRRRIRSVSTALPRSLHRLKEGQRLSVNPSEMLQLDEIDPAFAGFTF